MSQVFFISDLHFGHRNICKYRPQFKNPAEHDEFIVSNWNEVVNKQKYIVWVLGDFCIKNKLYDFDRLISRLNGNINLITGNHCWMPAYKHNKINLMPGLVSKYGFWLSHCPIHTEELRGKKNIHGHVHNKTLDDERYINVCVENVDYKPINLDEIRGMYDSTRNGTR